MSWETFKDFKGNRIGVQVSRGIISMENLDDLGIVPRPIELPLTELIKMVDFIVSGWEGEFTGELKIVLQKISRLFPTTSAT